MISKIRCARPGAQERWNLEVANALSVQSHGRCAHAPLHSPSETPLHPAPRDNVELHRSGMHFAPPPLLRPSAPHTPPAECAGFRASGKHQKWDLYHTKTFAERVYRFHSELLELKELLEGTGSDAMHNK
ncbi:unnamed protein product [Leptosia nina]|uniref:Uncharacterized protein n=1 Tax=Leptosia nina TaxID=320188 RepID=A0AAV1J9P6_9NEOP